jgi:serine/threonine-protein kinase
MPTKSEDLSSITSHSSAPDTESDPTSDKPTVNPSTAIGAQPVIPNYEISDEIAHGETSVIYRARDKKLGKDVAIKILRYSQHGNEAATQFVGRAKIQAQLQHPGIPPVFEVGSLQDGLPYQVMKLINGETLSTLLTERINPANDRVRFLSVFEHLCQTVAYAHSQNAIHRDLKPQHVMVDNFGDVQVIGWGSAMVLCGKDLVDSERQSSGLPLCGTSVYMAPEQARGEWGKIGSQTDVFELGGILIEILTGRPTFFGDSESQVRKKAASGEMSEAFDRLDRCGEEIELITIAKSCLNADPIHRPADAGALSAMISSYRKGIEERVRKSEAERLAAEFIDVEKGKKRQLMAALVLVVGLFLIWTVAMIWWKDKQAAVQRMFGGSREAEEKQTQQLAERDRAAEEKRIRDLKERTILLQKQKRQQLERQQPAKKQADAQADRIAPPPREVKRSGP